MSEAQFFFGSLGAVSVALLLYLPSRSIGSRLRAQLVAATVVGVTLARVFGWPATLAMFVGLLAVHGMLSFLQSEWSFQRTPAARGGRT